MVERAVVVSCVKSRASSLFAFPRTQLSSLIRAGDDNERHFNHAGGLGEHQRPWAVPPLATPVFREAL